MNLLCDNTTQHIIDIYKEMYFVNKKNTETILITDTTITNDCISNTIPLKNFKHVVVHDNHLFQIRLPDNLYDKNIKNYVIIAFGCPITIDAAKTLIISIDAKNPTFDSIKMILIPTTIGYGNEFLLKKFFAKKTLFTKQYQFTKLDFLNKVNHYVIHDTENIIKTNFNIKNAIQYLLSQSIDFSMSKFITNTNSTNFDEIHSLASFCLSAHSIIKSGNFITKNVTIPMCFRASILNSILVDIVKHGPLYGLALPLINRGIDSNNALHIILCNFTKIKKNNTELFTKLIKKNTSFPLFNTWYNLFGNEHVPHYCNMLKNYKANDLANEVIQEYQKGFIKNCHTEITTDDILSIYKEMCKG